MSHLLKAIPALIFWGIFIFVISQVPHPNTLTQASAFQLLAFFIPLFLALTFSFNSLINFYPRSISLSFGIVILLILRALGALNLVSAILTSVAILLLFSYFNPSTRSAVRLSSPSKSHSGLRKLTSRSNVPKIRNLQARKRR